MVLVMFKLIRIKIQLHLHQPLTIRLMTWASGSMPNKGALNWKPTTSTTYSVPAGYYSGGTLDSSAAYSKGVTDADARVNTSSANYKAGYNAYNLKDSICTIYSSYLDQVGNDRANNYRNCEFTAETDGLLLIFMCASHSDGYLTDAISPYVRINGKEKTITWKIRDAWQASGQYIAPISAGTKVEAYISVVGNLKTAGMYVVLIHR